MPAPRKVELHHAYMWVCDECGRDHFVRAVTFTEGEFDDTDEGREALEVNEELNRIAEELGLDSQFGGYWATSPSKVTCPHCEIEFDVDEFDGGESE